MFNSRKKQKLIEMIGMIKPTSKTALKQQCLFLCNLDITKAEQMYDFLIKDMEGIPSLDPETKTFVQNFGDSANKALAWFRENQDILSQGVDFIKGLTKKGNVTPMNVLPQINQ